MKTITTSKSSLTTTLGLAFVLILVALAFVGLFLAQRMQAVNPPPDGVRPGETQRKSRAPCLTPPAAHLTQRLVLFAPDQHSNKFNTAVGAGALFANIADNNTATGAGALLSDTTGIGNTATGSFALLNNSSERN